jgi:hypothetical protein
MGLLPWTRSRAPPWRGAGRDIDLGALNVGRVVTDTTADGGNGPFGGVILTLCTFLVYQPILTARAAPFEFVSADDFRYIVDNPRVTTGLTRENLWWALTSLHQSNWHPLTWMSWQLDDAIYGVDSWGFHLTNLALHLANSLLLFALLRRLTSAWGRSLVVAALFAVHPLHVESVAWVSERKDVLSTLFFLLTVGFYVSYVRARSIRTGALAYGLVVIFAVLCLMAKSMLVTLPCVLLLLDAWPLRRASIWRPLGEKAPLFIVAAFGAWVTLGAQTRMIEALDPVALPVRAGNALVHYVSYLTRTLWPSDLVVYRANLGVSLGWAAISGSAVVLALVSTIALTSWRPRPYLLVGWLWFLGTLVPVVGFVQVGFVATTDHYTYVPLVGLCIVIVWGAFDLLVSMSRWLPGLASTRVMGALASSVLLLACVLARRQVAYWHDSVALWQHVVDTSPTDAFARASLGVALDAKGRSDEARDELTKAEALDHDWKTHLAYGLAFEQQGNFSGARRELEKVLLVAPHNLTAVSHLAAQFQTNGHADDAIRQYTTLAHLQPRAPVPEYELSTLYEEAGDRVKARAHLVRALQVDPSFAPARSRLAALGIAP